MDVLAEDVNINTIIHNTIESFHFSCTHTAAANTEPPQYFIIGRKFSFLNSVFFSLHTVKSVLDPNISNLLALVNSKYLGLKHTSQYGEKGIQSLERKFAIYDKILRGGGVCICLGYMSAAEVKLYISSSL